MKFLSLKCPHCNADLEIEDGIDTFYCKYCGGKVILLKRDNNAIKAHVRIKELEHEENLRTYELEHASKEKDKEFAREMARKKSEDRSTLIPILIFILFFVFLLKYVDYETDRQMERLRQVPASAAELKKLSYDEAYSILQEAGFEDISCVSINKSPGLFHFEGQVYSISINGSTSFKAGSSYSKNAKIIISYYSSP